jgi:hypothetical protein
MRFVVRAENVQSFPAAPNKNGVRLSDRIRLHPRGKNLFECWIGRKGGTANDDRRSADRKLMQDLGAPPGDEAHVFSEIIRCATLPSSRVRTHHNRGACLTVVQNKRRARLGGRRAGAGGRGAPPRRDFQQVASSDPHCPTLAKTIALTIVPSLPRPILSALSPAPSSGWTNWKATPTLRPMATSSMAPAQKTTSGGTAGIAWTVLAVRSQTPVRKTITPAATSMMKVSPRTEYCTPPKGSINRLGG